MKTATGAISRVLWLAAWLALLLPLDALSAEPPESGKVTVEAPPQEVRPQGAEETFPAHALPGSAFQPGSRTLITEAQFRDSQQSVADVLESVPGLTLIRGGDSMAPVRVSIRGSRADQVLILLDGIPLRADADAPGAAQSTGRRGVDLAGISLDGVASIEVLRGAATALYGPGAAAGVIHINTKTVHQRRIAFNRTVGSGGYRESAAEWHQPLGKAGAATKGLPVLSLALKHRLSSGHTVYYDGNATAKGTETGQRCRKSLGEGYFVRRCNEQERLRADLRLEFEDGQRWRLEVENTRRRGLGGVEDPRPDGREEQLQTRLSFQNRWRPEADASTGLRLYGSRTDSQRRDTTAPGGERFAGGYRDDLSGAESWLERWWDNHQGTLKLSAAQQTLTDRNFSAEREQAGFSAQWNWHLSGGALEAALREDVQTGLIPQGTWRVAGAHFLAEPLGAKTSWATGYRPPSLYELYDPGAGESESAANPGLVPESSRAVDAGLFLERAGRYYTEVSTFRQDTTNNIVAVASRERPNRFRFENLAQTRSTGLELSASLHLSANTALDASASRTTAIIVSSGLDPRDAGNQVPGVPVLRWRTGLSWRREQWRASTSLRHSGRRYVDSANSRYLKSYRVWDAGLTVPLGAGFSLGLDGRNLANTAYADLENRPPPGRELLLSLRWRAGAETSPSKPEGQPRAAP